MKQQFFLRHDLARANALKAVQTAPEGYAVTVAEPSRTLEASAKFHAICTELARSGLPWAGKPRTAEQWKVLLVSGHSVASKQGAEMVPGLEGEFVNIRESTALMSSKRISSLIEYASAFLAMNEREAA
jgi:hypothetical protein